MLAIAALCAVAAGSYVFVNGPVPWASVRSLLQSRTPRPVAGVPAPAGAAEMEKADGENSHVGKAPVADAEKAPVDESARSSSPVTGSAATAGPPAVTSTTKAVSGAQPPAATRGAGSPTPTSAARDAPPAAAAGPGNARPRVDKDAIETQRLIARDLAGFASPQSGDPGRSRP
jgi:hypothetical protein